MKVKQLLFFVILLLCLCANAICITSHPIVFNENIGQWESSAKYRVNYGNAVTWLTDNGIVYQLIEGKKPTNSASIRHHQKKYDYSYKYVAIQKSFIGANSRYDYNAMEELSYKTHYFVGNNPDKWIKNAPTYNFVLCENVYQGIDIKHYTKSNKLEYDIIVSPGSDIEVIIMDYNGVDSLRINPQGDLVLYRDEFIIVEKAPVAYQIVNGKTNTVHVYYSQLSNKTIGYSILGTYDKLIPLIVDPIIEYTNIIDSLSGAYSIALNDAGNAYIVGTTYSTEFPLINAIDTVITLQSEAFISKLNAEGTSYEYSTYIGGESGEYAIDIAVNEIGDCFVTGKTSSDDFPIVNGYQSTFQGNSDGFVLKLNSNGSEIIYSSYLGGWNQDNGEAIVIDDQDCAYIAGYTLSNDFPVINAYDEVSNDIFVLKVDEYGSGLIYSTFLGGSQQDLVKDIAIDNDGNAYITGYTESSDFPMQVAKDSTHNGYNDVFVAKLNSQGNDLLQSTYLGGTGNDYGYGIEVDSRSNVVIGGFTGSTDFPVYNAQWDTYQGGSRDFFVTKYNPTCDSLIYSTYIGGSDNDEAWGGIAVDDNDGVAITGWSISTDFPLINSFCSDSIESYDIVFQKLNALGRPIYSSYFSSEASNALGQSVAFDKMYCLYLVGDIGNAAFVAKINPVRVCGDVNNDENVNIGDAVYLIQYIFKDGLGIESELHADSNCDTQINIGDVVYLVNYIFNSGDSPCANCL